MMCVCVYAVMDWSLVHGVFFRENLQHQEHEAVTYYPYNNNLLINKLIFLALLRNFMSSMKTVAEVEPASVSGNSAANLK